jgi:hypothetical protein
MGLHGINKSVSLVAPRSSGKRRYFVSFDDRPRAKRPSSPSFLLSRGEAGEGSRKFSAHDVKGTGVKGDVKVGCERRHGTGEADVSSTPILI